MSKMSPILNHAFSFSSNSEICMEGLGMFYKFIKPHQKRVKSYINNIVKFDFNKARLNMTIDESKIFLIIN